MTHDIAIVRARATLGRRAGRCDARDQVLGAMCLFGSTPGQLDERDLRLARALADVATIARIQDRVAADRDAVNEPLQVALHTRIVLEQAMGGPGVRRSRPVLARDFDIEIGLVARAVVDRALPPTAALEHSLHR